MSQTEKDIQCREIVTKAVCGRGRKFTQATHTITPSHSPTNILGCWIINHNYTATKEGDTVEVSGSYDINIWYSYNNNTQTQVATETVSYADQVPLTMMDKNYLDNGLQVDARATQQPTACEATISNSGHSVLVQVEREFLVEVIGETKVCVMVCPGGCDGLDDKEFTFDDDQDFEELDPDIVIDELD
ncbi:spore coat protein E [Caldalkalibacillus uzonensis]|uniref:Spore coat protein E n=1 Tax=Caldalkalibacillus uzonensis TaxID=353224 RepID=A0ABU0CLR0_9BACI|nr:outer spore coat protein CotE [Caldalkalibacillus uzonensis]MDQ0337348.1 spore coat protein E [Caldalkalibacillus uzonensis]